ncbi:hypothetical protein NCAS_0A03610 [Naumovozyma castellii]|uniref:Bromodomain associated domain-containing protein n=1 Tax=Naumovozyma castellii TaxID=27288 RepID=G0V629_NAUCA|nr:hypothetical protein NCAS_0A03610 [Naumovozyma castellii CBS 4309]CCC66919.1 hypothetical protein NCAS_0A03610 [Naumovozyma castellii CBS 4309]
MTADNEFHFSLLRVSIIQLLKAEGFDTATKTTVNTLTDLYIRYLNKLSSEITSVAQSRGAASIAIQDISQGFQNLRLFNPINLLDVFDENPANWEMDYGFEKWKDIVSSDPHLRNDRLVALPGPEIFQDDSLLKATTTSAVPGYINQYKDNSAMTNKDDQIIKLKDKATQEEEEEIEELINNGVLDNWIDAIIAKQRLELKSGLIQMAATKEERIGIPLPDVVGMNESVLGPSINIEEPNTDLIPTLDQEDNDDDNENIDSKLKHNVQQYIKLLPVSKPENRLENISLSFENEILSESEDDQQLSPPPPPSTQEKNEEDTHNTGSLAFNSTNEPTFAEVEDMDNTFQRRESIEY